MSAFFTGNHFDCSVQLILLQSGEYSSPELRQSTSGVSCSNEANIKQVWKNSPSAVSHSHLFSFHFTSTFLIKKDSLSSFLPVSATVDLLFPPNLNKDRTDRESNGNLLVWKSWLNFQAVSQRQSVQWGECETKDARGLRLTLMFLKLAATTETATRGQPVHQAAVLMICHIQSGQTRFPLSGTRGQQGGNVSPEAN